MVKYINWFRIELKNMESGNVAKKTIVNTEIAEQVRRTSEQTFILYYKGSQTVQLGILSIPEYIVNTLGNALYCKINIA